jgi:hypothetical protein
MRAKPTCGACISIGAGIAHGTKCGAEDAAGEGTQRHTDSISLYEQFVPTLWPGEARWVKSMYLTSQIHQT